MLYKALLAEHSVIINPPLQKKKKEVEIFLYSFTGSTPLGVNIMQKNCTKQLCVNKTLGRGSKEVFVT